MRKLSHNSITLLVLGCISVAIERPFIPADWEYDLEVSQELPWCDLCKLPAQLLGYRRVVVALPLHARCQVASAISNHQPCVQCGRGNRVCSVAGALWSSGVWSCTWCSLQHTPGTWLQVYPKHGHNILYNSMGCGSTHIRSCLDLCHTCVLCCLCLLTVSLLGPWW